MTTFLLIRHGLTDEVGSVLSGTAPGVHLNAAGRAQASAVAARLDGVRIAAVISSPLERARETARPIAVNHNLDVDIAPAFSEFEFGEWTGRAIAELDDNLHWRHFNTVRGLVRPPGGELMLDVQQRAVTALLELETHFPDQTVVVISHGDVIRAALLFFLGMPIDYVHRLEVSPARISILVIDSGPPRVLQVNGDTATAIA